MNRKMGYQWHLRKVMAERGMFATTASCPCSPSAECTSPGNRSSAS